MIYTNSITSKGQITLPKKLRDKIGLETGKSARISLLDKNTIVISKPLTVEEIREKIGKPANDQPLTDSEKLNLVARGLL